MARFIAVAAFYIGGVRYKAGTRFADSAGVAVAGDVLLTALTTVSNLNPKSVRPLDAAGQTSLTNAGFPGVALWTIPLVDAGGVGIGAGVDSVDV